MDIKDVREAVGCSQRELAERLEVSQSLVAQWERGAAKPSEVQLGQLEGLRRRSEVVVQLDSYPSAPAGGKPGSREAEERLAWVNARNRMIQASDRDLTLHAKG